MFTVEWEASSFRSPLEGKPGGLSADPPSSGSSPEVAPVLFGAAPADTEVLPPFVVILIFHSHRTTEVLVLISIKRSSDRRRKLTAA